MGYTWGMMSLKQYLEANSIRQADFANTIGTSQGAVSKMASGAMTPSPELARCIHDQTGGQVPYWSWPPYAGFAPDAGSAA